MTAKKCLTILQNQKDRRGIEPWSPGWKARVLPLHCDIFGLKMPKITFFKLKRGGPTGPPLGSQAYKIYVGSIRVKSYHKMSQIKVPWYVL